MNASEPAISVVVPARNAAGTIAAQMEALARQTFGKPWEIVVVDNGSTDGTAAVARSVEPHPRCTVCTVTEPRAGLNTARNAGVRAARSSLVAICDADDVVDPRWVAELVNALRHHDVVAGGLSFTLLNDSTTCQLRGWGSVEAPAPSVGRELRFLEQAMCGNIAFRKVVWAAVGGFDEAFEGGGDDVDFSWRIQLAGYRIHSQPTAVLHYRARSTRWQMFKQYSRDGAGSAHLYAVHRQQGMPRRPVAKAVLSIARLLLALPSLAWATPARQGHLIRAAGKQWGRLRGSLRHRLAYL